MDVTVTVQTVMLPTVTVDAGQMNEVEDEKSSAPPVLTVTTSPVEQSEEGADAESVTMYE